MGSGESIKSPGSEVGGARRYALGRWLVEGCDILCAGMQRPGKPVGGFQALRESGNSLQHLSQEDITK